LTRLAQRSQVYKLPASLEAPLTRFDSGLTLADVLPSDEAPDAADRDTAGSQLRADLDNVLCTLSAREAGVLRARYGLDDGCPRTLEDIGQAFQVRSGPGAQAPRSFCLRWGPGRHAAVCRVAAPHRSTILGSSGSRQGALFERIRWRRTSCTERYVSGMYETALARLRCSQFGR